MKFRITILFAFIFLNSNSQGLTDSVIQKNNIRQLTVITKNKIKNSFHTVYHTRKTITTYNKQGHPIVQVAVTYNPLQKEKDSTITICSYKDTNLSKVYWKEYTGTKLIDEGSESYSYSFTFDSLKRKTSETVEIPGGRITKEEYVWNTSNKINEIRYYSNDSAIYIPERRGYDFLWGKNLHLSKIVKNYWDVEHNLLKSVECKNGCRLKYINDSLCCTHTEYSIHKDTLIRKNTFYNEGWQTVYEKEYSMPYGVTYLESYHGDKSLIFEQRDKKGLIIKQESYQIDIQGSFTETLTTYEYKFYTR